MWHQPSSPLSVSQLNRQVKQLLESQFPAIPVQGEISTLSRPASGHIYFTLKDQNAQIRCAMFKGQLARNRYVPKQGDEVLVQGRLSLYEGRGDYQLIANSIAPVGEGELQAAFFQMKERLAAEGLFDAEHKKPLPESIQTVGLVTSSTGAAVQDILTVLKRRYPAIKAILYPSQVQGAQATQTLVEAIETANRRNEVDVLIVGRGGGSLEDLWCFNTEPVARALFSSELPVISAVGHEVDFSIADFVADVRAATPSQAAELVSPDQYERIQRVDQLTEKLYYAVNTKLALSRQRLLQTRQRLKSPQQTLSEWRLSLHIQQSQLIDAIKQPMLAWSQRLSSLTNRLERMNPAAQLKQQHNSLVQLESRLQNSIQHSLGNKQVQLANCASQLNILSPLATLERGYSITKDDAGNIIRDVSELAEGQEIQTEVAQGRIRSRVVATEPATKPAIK
ncbi:exodeoxyribonuclease VII large subunit [Reinekea thalattae]|uniref:Exodeoxyribonuclease 7 large subunit n=1 Tax=Reinekea thalattae TaxID=2593301 RepID=A0A5C8Z7M2_9GAMM|nr:exodeoxyribonuclease VII large subunit [Reinekea thalattae]TXR53319.1 exodeoxyribonuclease VII large subunit [Reinekea thalattae]